MQVFKRRGFVHNQGLCADHTGSELHRLRMLVTPKQELADGKKYVEVRLNHPVVR